MHMDTHKHNKVNMKIDNVMDHIRGNKLSVADTPLVNEGVWKYWYKETHICWKNKYIYLRYTVLPEYMDEIIIHFKYIGMQKHLHLVENRLPCLTAFYSSIKIKGGYYLLCQSKLGNYYGFISK